MKRREFLTTPALAVVVTGKKATKVPPAIHYRDNAYVVLLAMDAAGLVIHEAGEFCEGHADVIPSSGPAAWRGRIEPGVCHVHLESQRARDWVAANMRLSKGLWELRHNPLIG